MIKVLFKSEELLIAADSESAVVYGNTTKTEVVVKTAKSSVVKTAEDSIASKFSLKAEESLIMALRH